MNHLFLFTITPVQDFISQSRKLLDLYGSSSILSCMSEIGIMICNREKGKTVFPYYDKKNSSNSYPNRFLVEFENKSLDDIKNIAKVIESSLQKFLKGLNSKNHQKIYEHIENYFSFYWAISEIENDGYKNAFKVVEKRLAGAKNTRIFTQLANGEGERGRKCSICGERNVIIYQNPLSMLEEQIDNDEPKKDKIAQKQEGLCGVCYIKRRYGKDRARFESTADIALMNIFNKKNLDKKSYPLLKKDPQLFFEENLTDTYFKKYGYRVKKLSKYKEQYQQFQNDIKNSALKQTSYYAVIMFDGDNMGKWLSGNKKIKGKELYKKINLQEFHTSLSEKLMDFANNVKKINNLVTVYAGGEDFLGFVNINYLFEILQLLRDRWNEIVNKPIKDFTFSAGVVIAHYKTPLHEVLKRVRSSEKEAKKFFGKDKNAICLTALKRSGEIVEGVIKYDNIKTLQNILDELKENFSDGFISILDREFSLISNEDIETYQVEIEIKRLLKRALLEENYSINTIEENLQQIFEMNLRSNFRNFINILYFIRFIKRKIK